jgi:DNA-binding MarR family transcriptional regulator
LKKGTGIARGRVFTLEDPIVAALRRIIRAVDLHSRRLVEQSGLTGPQWLTLREAARLGRPPAGVLARAVNLSQPTVSGILDRLERRGLVERVRDNEDRRSVAVSVTEVGQRLLAEARRAAGSVSLELSRLQGWEQTRILAPCYVWRT